MITVTQMPDTRRRSVLTWVPVTDAEGRTHMEMRWAVKGARRAAPVSRWSAA